MGILKSIYGFFFVLLLCVVSACTGGAKNENEGADVPPSVTDYQGILESGKLVALLENSTNSYFIYRGQKMGYEYEILSEFAKDLGVELEVKMVANLDNIFDMLDNKEGDVVGCNLTVTLDRQKEIDFSIPYIQSPQVIIQRKADTEVKGPQADFISEPYQLANKTVSVWENSSYYQRLQYLQNEIGDTIFVDDVNGLIGAEELIERVSQGIIDYTIVEEDVARINARFYTNIDYSTAISVKQNIAFGLRKESTLLKAKLDKWMAGFLKSKTHQYIYRKYFESDAALGYKMDEPAMKVKRGHISPFDDLFKAVAKNSEVGWQLLAAIAHTESRFNPSAEGFGGAYGMMQFMPNTGPKYGVFPDSPVNVQIAGGMKKINADLKYWNFIQDPEQRIKFALASYNAGRGHVIDAYNLSKKHGVKEDVWDGHVAKMMMNLSKQEYYRDEVVKSGSIRGTMTVKYVETVYQKYLNWKEGVR